MVTVGSAAAPQDAERPMAVTTTATVTSNDPCVIRMPFPVAGPVREVATLHACAASVSARGEPYAYQGSFEVMAPVRTPGVENPPASAPWGAGPADVGFGSA